MKNVIKSKKLYSPQNYLELITGNTYIISGDNDILLIENILKQEGYCLWNYSINEVEHLIESEIPVVLVDCMVYNEDKKEYQHEYRWFEVDFEENLVDDTVIPTKKENNRNKFYFDVTEKYIKTIAVEADNITQAIHRVEKAYDRKEFEINHLAFDDVEIKNSTQSIEKTIKEGWCAEEEIETFNCNDVVYNENEDSYECPVCGRYLCSRTDVKDLDSQLPSYCQDCGTKLHY
jgi:hypothetical protein